MRKQKKEIIAKRIGKFVLYIVMIGGLIVNSYTLYKTNAYEDAFKPATEQEQVQDDVQDEDELPGDEVEPGTEVETPSDNVEPGTEPDPEVNQGEE